MSEENVEIVRRVFEEFQAGMERGDPGALFDSETVADDYEWITDAPLDGRSVRRGREGFVEFMRTWTEEFEDWSIQVERWIDAGDDRVVAHASVGNRKGERGAGRAESRPGLRAGRWTHRSGEELTQLRRSTRSRRAAGVGRSGLDVLEQRP
jgi:ketosteroid isomerase-like protein